MVRLLARFGENYRTSPLSADDPQPGTGGPRAGDRLPDAATTAADGRPGRLHTLLARPGVHLLVDACVSDTPPPGPLLHVHRLTHASRGTILAVRPDGHVGYRGPPGDALRQWLARMGTPAEARPR